jgi:hypothetical protein
MAFCDDVENDGSDVDVLLRILDVYAEDTPR